MIDKEKLELLNLRKKVEAQRVEIKRMNEQLERHKEYIIMLEELIDKAEKLKDQYDFVKFIG